MSATQADLPPPPGVPTDDLKLLLPGRIDPAGAGWEWIAEGWRLFAKAPLMWIVALLILIVIYIILSLLWFVGHIASSLLSPVFAAGLMVACRALERGEPFELEHVFAGFKRNAGNLVLVGLITLAAEIVILMVFVAFVGFSIAAAMIGGNSQDVYSAVMASGTTLALGGLVALALLVPLAAAYWFAPALVVMHGLGPVAAMKASFFGSFRNFVPSLVYGLIMLVFGVLAAIPIGLGYLVWIPVAIASTYAAYRSIFTDPPPAPRPRPGVPAA